MSQFVKANDDKERQTWLFHIWNDTDTPLQPSESIEISIALNDRFKSASYFTSFCADSYFDTLTKSRVENWQHPTMWAMYGRRHSSDMGQSASGSAIIFDTKKVISSGLGSQRDGNLAWGYVKYITSRDESSSMIYNVLYSDYKKLSVDKLYKVWFTNFWKEFFFTKFSGWSHEHEFRIVSNSRPATPLSIDITDCILEVIVGHESSDTEKNEIKILAQRSGFTVSEIRWRNGIPLKTPLIIT